MNNITISNENITAVLSQVMVDFKQANNFYNINNSMNKEFYLTLLKGA